MSAYSKFLCLMREVNIRHIANGLGSVWVVKVVGNV